MVQRIKKHYHWIIAILVFLEMIVYGGLINSASVFTLPISESLGVSTTSYSVAMMPYTLTCFLGTSLSGWLFGRFGYKKVATLSLVLVAFSLVLTANAHSLLVFGISKVMFGMGYAACLTAGAVYVIKDWFWKHQGLVLGAVNMSTGLGGSLMTVILTGVLEKKDWRAANLVAAAIVAVVAVLYLFMKSRPEQMGLRAYGFGTAVKTQKKENRSNAHWPGFPLKEQFKSPAFYIMCLCVLASCTCIYMTSSFIIPHFTSLDYTSAEAAFYQSTYMLILAVVKLAVGYFYDRFGAKPVMVVCMTCAVVGQAMMGMTADPVLSFVGVAFFSVGLCMTSLMVPLLATPLFGYKACLSINGIFLGLSSLASMFANPLSSLCYDNTGTYGLGFRLAAMVNIGVFALYLLLFAISKKEQARYYALHPEEA